MISILKSLCQGDITKINDDATVYATSETVISEFGINGAIHEATGIVTWMSEINACETVDCKVT